MKSAQTNNDDFRLIRSRRNPARHGMNWSRLVLLVGCVALLVTDAIAETVSVPYSFSDEDSGGAALAQIDVESGRILSNQVLFDSSECLEPLKIRQSADRRTVVVTNLAEAGPQLMLWSANEPNDVTPIRLPSVPDEVRLTPRHALLTLKEDAVAAVDLVPPHHVLVRELDKLLKPPANAPEDLVVDASGKFVVVSFQKDSSSGKKKGNRLVVLKQSDLSVVADLPLPRNYPDLHIQGNPKEAGPGPEVICISPTTDTLAVTLDLYGAVAMTLVCGARRSIDDRRLDTRQHRGDATNLRPLVPRSCHANPPGYKRLFFGLQRRRKRGQCADQSRGQESRLAAQYAAGTGNARFCPRVAASLFCMLRQNETTYGQ